MKTLLSTLIAVLLAWISLNADAATTRYVALNSLRPTPPYDSWPTAATNIQDAVEMAVDGDLVLVTNGIYQTGGGIAVDATMNLLAVTKPITVQSVNGPSLTLIDGGGGMRCVYLTNGSALAGFTLTNGTADGGGGAWCESVAVVVSNCVITGNSASGGGGVQSGTLNNCVLGGNSAGWVGGGAAGSVLNNCLLTNNSSYFCGAAAGCTLSNCTILNNYAGADSAVAEGSTFENCLLSGNYSTIEGLTAWYCTFNNCTLVENSAGVAHCDLNNCILYYNGENSGVNTFNYSCTTPLPVGGIGNITSAPRFRDQPGGDFRLQTNSQCINGGKNIYVGSSVDLDDNPRIFDGNVDMGAYEFQQIRPRVVRYVDVNSLNPASPHTDWATAAVTIQDAIDVAYHGDLILVTNGLYGTGGRAVYDTMTNRVAVDWRLVLQSVNGPEFTIIEGFQVPDTVYGDGAIRCVYLTEDALLSGFTLTNGATRASGDYETQMYGGGLWCEASGALVSNCVVTGNSAISAGGVYRGTLNHCVIRGNSAADAGGGAFVSELNNCLITSNSAGSYGGGAYGTLRGCIISHNFARYSAGANGYLQNCTVVSNTASALGGGAEESELNNCIVYYNSDRNGADTSSSTLNFCCTPTGGNGNITNEPRFVNLAAGDYRLQANSPCINAGKNSLAPDSPDVDGNPRIAGGTVDIGAYEFPSPASTLSYAWAQQYGLPTDGTADFTDLDGDGFNNREEWLAGSDPTDAQSAPPHITVQPASQIVTVGHDAIFSVTASGTLPLSYQWYFNGTNDLAGATNATLIVTNVQLAEAGYYAVNVANGYDFVISSNALLKLNQAPIADASATQPIIISANGTNATVILDGTRSSDPDGDLLQYFWFEAGSTSALATGVVAVIALPIGTHPMSLVANDGLATDTNAVTVSVLTTSQAVQRLIAQVTSKWPRSQPLMATLSAALASLERNNPVSAINQLLAFQTQVRAQVAPLDPALATTLIQLGQEIIDVLSGGNTNPGGRPHGRFTAVNHQSNGRVQLHFAAERGPVYLLEASTNLVDWEKIGVAVDQGDGTFTFKDANAAKFPNRFYRTVRP